VVLGDIAGKVFCGPEWDDRYPSLDLKFQIMMLMMDSASGVFRGNGYELLLLETSKGSSGRGGGSGKDEQGRSEDVVLFM